MRTIALLALLAGSALGDELRLKDGKAVPWKTLSDEGDEYLVDGKTRVKKADVERIVISKPEALPPLAGATFSLDRKKTVTMDILSKADVNGKDVTGIWKWENKKVLLGSAMLALNSKIPFDIAPPEEYDLTLQVSGGDVLTGGSREFAVGLVVPGSRQVGFHVDAFECSLSCLSLVDGQSGEQIRGRVFEGQKPRVLKFMVRKEALIVQLDGKDHWSWRADWSKVSLANPLKIRSTDRIFVTAVSGTWRIQSAVLSFEK